ncbi:uncharacterized protein [Haliotis asinina]|uniref:uncharacterized protein n=1 Tax=Haliotis asinina TaxID=109174 RepID=UPI003531CAD1
MSLYTDLSWLLTCTSLICLCNCQDSLVSVIHKMDQFEEDLLDNKADVLRIEKRVLNIIDVAKTELRAQVKENIREQVRDAIAEILQEEPLQDMVKSGIVSELRHLKQVYRQVERQIHHVSRSLNDLRNKTDVFHESVLKRVDIWNGEDTGDVCVNDKLKLELELQKSNVYIADLKADNERLAKLNEMCQSQISQLNSTPSVLSSSQASQHVSFTSRSTGSTTSVTRTKRPVTTTKSPVLTTSLTTPMPSVLPATALRSQDGRRILISPLGSSFNYKFRQLNIDSNSLSVYPYHYMRMVTSVTYITKAQKLLIGLYNPTKIVSSTLDTSNVTVLMEGVYTTGMTVDEGRDIIFMSTYRPRYSISRMSTQGKNYSTIANLLKFGGFSRQIALDTRTKRIYGCLRTKLFTVTYDGQGPATLVRGKRMHAVTLDQTAGVLYYNNDLKLMKMTVSSNVSSEVTTLYTRPWDMVLYRDTMYFSDSRFPLIGVVKVTHNSRACTLQSINVKAVDTLCLCVIP